MELRTTGDDINSWVDLEECQVIIAEVPNDDIGYVPARPTDAFEFSEDDIPFILEAQRQISALFHFKGERTNPLQRLAWPRRGYVLGNARPGPNWFSDTYPTVDGSYEDLAYHIHWEMGQSAFTVLPSDMIPQDIKDAAVILAALRKNGFSIYEDNKGDQTTYSLGPISGDNINAVARANAVFERLARWGIQRRGMIKAGGANG
jgi:hypothetical protein